ncbi:hypothetical protein D3C86_1806470 [compost metagenome]
MLYRLYFLKMSESVRTAEQQRWNKTVHLVVTKSAELFLCRFEQVVIIVVTNFRGKQEILQFFIQLLSCKYRGVGSIS